MGWNNFFKERYGSIAPTDTAVEGITTSILANTENTNPNTRAYGIRWRQTDESLSVFAVNPETSESYSFNISEPDVFLQALYDFSATESSGWKVQQNENSVNCEKVNPFSE